MNAINKKTYIITFLVIFGLVGAGFIALAMQTADTNEKKDNDSYIEQISLENAENLEELALEEQEQEEIEVEEPIRTLRITAVGDLMVHSPQITAAYNRETQTYSYYDNFKYVKPYIERADIAIGNLETVFAGPESGFTGYPLFNTPDEFADALKFAGFDTIITTNNHSIDRGKQGLLRTIDVLEEKGFDFVGTRRNKDEQSYIVKNVNDINVGITAYTYETPMVNNRKAINGILMNNELAALIDSFSYERLDEDLAKMEERIMKLQNAGSDLIVVYLHWGNEYATTPNHYQRRIASELAAYGADIIIGSHPHVIQPYEIIYNENRGTETVVFYSLGNFISNQRVEYLGTYLTENGIIVNIDIEKNKDGTSIQGISYTPTWVHKYRKDGVNQYDILPLPDAIQDIEAFNLQENKLQRVTNAKASTGEIITSESSGRLYLEAFLEQEELYNISEVSTQ
ncbi:CapA family protein [Desulfuribacillus alkaliarsenatis]|uniref:CapA family protein n=1 Tax=Desulfuribacillus alkaliarsenatis TaxID=766136 RepID=UPI00114D0DAC|nr:CapA family protein [Desulfuribacillus alkaliarsenatis]